jgi:hypothetical protein
MKASEIIEEINKLPISKRIYILERSIHLIRKHEEQQQMKYAAEKLSKDYEKDEELTVFTTLDFDNFYETR